MSAVGSDAAFMLEKALEEMDDIFRDNEEPRTFIQSSTPEPISRPPGEPSTKTDVSGAIKHLNELEKFLSNPNLWQQLKISPKEKEIIVTHGQSLHFVSMLFRDLYDMEQVRFISSS